MYSDKKIFCKILICWSLFKKTIVIQWSVNCSLLHTGALWNVAICDVKNYIKWTKKVDKKGELFIVFIYILYFSMWCFYSQVMTN